MKEKMEKRKEIGKVKLDFNDSDMVYGVQCVFESKDGKEVYKTFQGELDEFIVKGENRDYNKYENGYLRNLLGLPSSVSDNFQENLEEVKGIKLAENCQLTVSFTSYFSDNPKENSVTFPLKELTSEEITNDLLSKKFPKVFQKELRLVTEFVNRESAAYLKPLVERYTLDNAKIKESKKVFLKKKTPNVKMTEKDNDYTI